MDAVRASRVSGDSAGNDLTALEQYLTRLRPILDDRHVTEVCINRPGEAFVERRTGWTQEHLPFATYGWCEHLARLAAVATHQRIAAESPLLAAALPSGERLQVVLPPACTPGTVALTIRKPSAQVMTLERLSRGGLFARCAPETKTGEPVEQELAALHRAGQYEAFLRLAVKVRKNIIVSGPTGSGKTTFTKALILEIPSDERLISIEDAQELNLDGHANSVRLFYSKEGQGLAKVTPKQLLEATLRMRPDRILLAELRSDEAYYYLRNVNSGHPGSITSVHASSARLAFEQLMLLVKESPGGRDLSREDITALLMLLVDVVVQFGVEKQERFVKEVWWRGTR
jgi:type IV secretion system protein VirB11